MSQQNSDRGVLTATDSTFFPAVWATAISLKRQGIPYAVVDHSLLPEQAATLEDQGAILLEDCEKKGYRKTAWQLRREGPLDLAIPARSWHKPLVCQRSPFDHTVWIDADAIATQETALLFEQGDFITKDHFVSEEWSVDNERRLCRRMGIRVNPQVANINSGVFGFHRDAKWIGAWRDTCDVIVNAPSLSSRAKCRDQSALVAMLSMGHRGIVLPKILNDPIFNYPADGLMNTNHHNRLSCSISGPILLKETIERHPDALVVHWMGPTKPWQLQSKSIFP